MGTIERAPITVDTVRGQRPRALEETMRAGNDGMRCENESRRRSVSCRPSFLMAGVFVAATAFAQDPRLSEIRIDQPSTDDDEYLELAAPAGAALDGLTYVVLGDGSGGSGVVEAVVDLDGLVVPASGFFVAAEATFSLATPDLVTELDFENSDNVTHLLVRAFTGSNGDDLDSDDDGTLDSTPWNELVDCLALVETPGSGDRVYCADSIGPDGSFVPAHVFRCDDGWRIGAFDPAGGLDTPGAANACAPPGPGEPSALVINEVDYDQPGIDAAEFIELANPGSDPVDLGDLALVLVNGTGGGGAPYQTIPLPSVVLPPGGYFVVCGDAATVPSCDLDTSPDTNLIQNGSPDAVALVRGGSVVDAVSYEGDTAAPYTEGSGAGLEDPSFGGVGGPNENLGISRIPDGADTDQNDVDFRTACITPGRANIDLASDCPTPGPPPLVINEIDYDQPGTDDAEFVEILNTGSASVSLDGIVLELVNGSTGSVYLTIPLPAADLAAGATFVVCGDAARVPHCDLDVTPDTNLIQNGAPDAVALRSGGALVDTVSYEGDTAAPYTEGSGAGLADSSSTPFLGISRLPNGFDTDQNNVDFRIACITPGRASSSLASGCGALAPRREIYEIQGSGAASPFDGEALTTGENVVTALAQNGFFMQTPAARTDGDVDTSDGIFVFTSTPPAVAVGDLVEVTGEVEEFFDFTEIAGAPEVTVLGGGVLPPAVTFDAAIPSPDPAAPSCALEYECYEGMLVEIPTGTVGGPSQTFSVDPVAEAHVTARSARPFREPGILFPGLAGLPVFDGNPEIFELDPDRLGLPNLALTAGSTFSARGVLGFEFGGYELWPTELSVTPRSLPEPVRPRASGEMTIGSLNLFRLFDDQADGTEQVVSTAEYARRLAKLAAHVNGVLGAPDVLAVQEAEKLGVLEDLAATLQALDPALLYASFLVEGNDVGGIDVGFLVRSSVVVDALTQLGAAEVLSVDGSPLHDRPPLLLEGRFVGGGGSFPFAVMAVHNRSLGGIDDPSTGARVRQKRLEQAQSIAEKVQAIQTGDPTLPFVVLGDFNAFESSDGYVDVVGQIRGEVEPADNLLSGPDLVEPNLENQVVSLLPAGERYSFVFAGTAQALDHALTSEAARPWVRDLAFGRGNADAPLSLLADPATPLRASDHDGLVLYLMTDGDGDGVGDDLDLCPGTEIPEAVPLRRLGRNRWALVDDDRLFDTDAPPGGGPGDSFTVEETGGCSCEQIVEVLGLGQGHLWFGCSTGVMRQWVSAVAAESSSP